MKRLPLICLLFLLFIILSFAGCTMRETAAPVTGTDTNTPSSTPEATATPEPIPTPVPIGLIIEQSAPSYVFPSDYDQLLQALKTIEQNKDKTLWEEKGNWYIEDPADGVQLTATRMGEGPRTGDIMATDGQHLYLLADKDLVILDLSPDGASVVSRTKIGEDWSSWEDTSAHTVNGSEKIPFAVFCKGDRLIVLSDYYNYTSDSTDLGYTEYTSVATYDISDPALPLQLTDFGQEGAPVSAEVNGDALLVITERPYTIGEGDTNPSDFVPSNHYKGESSVLSPEKLLAVEDGRSAVCSVVGVYDFAAGGLTDERVVYGAPAEPFISDGEIIFIVSRVAEGFSRSYNDPADGSSTEFAAAACTDLYRFVLDKSDAHTSILRFDGIYTLEGAVEDPRCLDRYDGQMRCAVIRDERWRTDLANGGGKIERSVSCDILLFDGTFTVVGAAENLSEGFPDCWIGYLGDKAVVTDRGSSSALVKLNGVELQPDVTQLPKAVSAQAIRSLDDLGYTAFYRSEAGKLTLTVYDAEMEPLVERIFGSDHSSTLENLAGYFTDGASGIIAFSADDSYCVYGFDPEKGLSLKGDVFLSDWAWNARGFILDGYLYVADTRELFIYDLTDFSLISRVEF